MSASKDTNPKDAVGTTKVPVSTVPAPVIAEVGLALLEGARKYGRHNYRVAGVRASVYYDAVMIRHLGAWWEGEDTDPDSGLSHITKAISGLVVLRDAMIQGNWIDDRPPPSPSGWIKNLNAKAAEIIARHPEAREPFMATDTPDATVRKLRGPSPEVEPTRADLDAQRDAIQTALAREGLLPETVFYYRDGRVTCEHGRLREQNCITCNREATVK